MAKFRRAIIPPCRAKEPPPAESFSCPNSYVIFFKEYSSHQVLEELISEQDAHIGR